MSETYTSGGITFELFPSNESSASCNSCQNCCEIQYTGVDYTINGQQYQSLHPNKECIGSSSKESIRPLHTNTQENASTLERILTEQFGENGKHLGTTLQYSSKLEYFTYELLSRNTELLSKEKQEE